MIFAQFIGGPLDGETRTVHEGSKFTFQTPSGVRHVYRPRDRTLRVWDYDLEASTIETLRGEQKRRDMERPSY